AKQVVVRFDTLGLPLDTYSNPGVLDTRLIYVGTTITIPQHTLQKEGSSHGGWFYNGVNYKDGEKFVVPDENVTFTPYWFNYHVLTYKAGDFDDIVGQTTATVQVTEGTGYDLADSSRFTRPGYNLVGWQCSLDDKVYGTLERYTVPDSDVTFTAVWSPALMEITISANNGVTTDKITDYAYAGDEYVLPECTFTNGEKTFSGWKYNNVVYMPGDTITVPALLKGQRVVIVAYWK
ncbi:MAG: InlB B-repeat-containing protein, partial [Porcipelethomonas sp.]